MTRDDPDKILALLRDPNVESQEIAQATGAPREEAGRAARIVAGISKAKPEEALSLPPPLALAVARAALQVKRADILVALAAHPARDVTKDAKRGLHLLKSRGVTVPEVPLPAPPASAPAVEPSFACFSSAIDGQGERAIWVTRPVVGRGVEIGQMVVSDTLGILEFEVGFLGRKEFRHFSRELLGRGSAMGVAEIDRERAKSLVAAARLLNDSSGQAVPKGADIWLSRLGPAKPLEDPAALFPPLPDEEERASVADSAQLHELPFLRDWLAEEDALRSLEQKLQEISVSELYISEEQRKEQHDRTIADAIEAYFDPARRRRTASRLLEVALSLSGSGDLTNARRAACVARAIGSGQPVAGIPFARLLVEKAFSVPAGKEAEPADPDPARAQSSLIIDPTKLG
jgi:hypothetical protein